MESPERILEIPPPSDVLENILTLWDITELYRLYTPTTLTCQSLTENQLHLIPFPNHSHSLNTTLRFVYFKVHFTIPSKLIDQLWIPLDKIVHHNNTIGETYKSKIRFVRVRSEQAHLPIRIEDPFEDKPMDIEKVSLRIAGRYRIRYMCNFDLRKFPFDVQYEQ